METEKDIRKSITPYICMILAMLGMTIYVERKYGIRQPYAAMCMGLCLLMFAGSCFAFWLNYKKSPAVWKLYSLLAGVFGIVFILMIPVSVVPDEQLHIISSYTVSNSLMGISSPSGSVMIREGDTYLLEKNTYNLEDFNTYLGSIVSSSGGEKLIAYKGNKIATPMYQYYPSAIMLTVCRLLKFSPVMTMILSRFINMILSVLLIGQAIRITPIGKSLMAVLALMPMTMQQISSFSYDWFVISVSFLVIALSFDMYGNISKGNSPGLFRYLILCALALLLIPTKSYAYTPVAAIPLLLYIEGKYHFFSKNRKTILYILAGILLAAVLYFVWAMLLDPLHGIEETNVRYKLPYFIHNPEKFLILFGNTVETMETWYMDTFVGLYLGLIDKYTRRFIVYVIIVVLIFAGIRRKDQDIVLPSTIRKLLLASAAVTILFTVAGMSIHWTRTVSPVIEGIQGRYFIPISVLCFLGLQSESFEADSKVDNSLLLTMGFMLFITVFYLMRMY